MSSNGKDKKKKWYKPIGILLIVVAYVLLATGIVLACFAFLPTKVRIIVPIVSLVLFALSGSWGYILCERAESLNRRGVLYVLTLPCRIFATIFESM